MEMVYSFLEPLTEILFWHLYNAFTYKLKQKKVISFLLNDESQVSLYCQHSDADSMMI